PITSMITPSPHLPWSTSSPILRPKFSAPLVAAGAALRRSLARSAPSTMAARPPPQPRPPLDWRVGLPALVRPPSDNDTSSSGTSLRKRLGGLYCVEPHNVRHHAL